MSDGDWPTYENGHHEGVPALWPSPEYDRQVSLLTRAIGERVYIVEAHIDTLHITARFSSTVHELLALVDFPRPDPARRLYPHLLLLDDGRGINLGRILRVSRTSAYATAARDCLFEDRTLYPRVLPKERHLSKQRIRAIARRQIGEFTGPAGRQLAGTTDKDRP